MKGVILAGGLVERTLASSLSTMHPGEKIDRFVSLADIAPFLTYLLNLSDSLFIGENLFAETRTHPVISGLDSQLFLPESA